MKAGIIGATGYAGAELVRLLLRHPAVDALVLSSVSFEGERIEHIYPNFIKSISSPLVKADNVIVESDVVFAALPHGVTEQYAKDCIEKKKPFIDLSAGFRFGEDESIFKAWYAKPYDYPELHANSVYGLPELNRKRIKELAASGSIIVGNPGCYPTGALLGVFPALAKGLAAGTVIINSVSGTTGGGREPSRSFHYPECADSVAPYKVGSQHRHTPEITRGFAAMASLENRYIPQVIFTPHLAPMNRGILSTIYIPLTAEWQAKTEEIETQAAGIHALYTGFYRDEPFVRVLPLDAAAGTNRVRQSNYCDISVHLDHKGSTLIIISAIDNMVKGAAGQAIQNMNIIFGFEEDSGLTMVPSLF